MNMQDGCSSNYHFMIPFSLFGIFYILFLISFLIFLATIYQVLYDSWPRGSLKMKDFKCVLHVQLHQH